jgi:hypothetical protein
MRFQLANIWLHQLSLRSYWSHPLVIRRAATRLRFVASGHDSFTGTSSSRMVIGRAGPYRALGIMQTGQITEPLRDYIKGDSRFSTSLRRSRRSSNDLSTDKVHPDLDMKQAKRIQDRFVLLRT